MTTTCLPRTAKVTVKIAGIPAGVRRVRLEHFRIDETTPTHSRFGRRWARRRDPTPEQYAQLKAAGQLQLLTSPEWLDVSGGV